MKCLIISGFQLPNNNNRFSIDWILKYTPKRREIQILSNVEAIDIFQCYYKAILLIKRKWQIIQIPADNLLPRDEKFYELSFSSDHGKYTHQRE